MVSHTRVAALLMALGVSTLAHARPIDNADDPALADAITHGFEGIIDASPGAAAFVLGRTLVTIETTAVPPGDILQCVDASDCQLTTYMDAPVTLTFDPPVAAVGMFMWYSVGPFGMVVTGDGGVENLDDQSLGWQHPDSSYAGATDIGAISTVLLTAADYSTYWDDLRIVEGSAAGTGVDVTLAVTSADAWATAGGSYAVDLRAHNSGPTDASATQIIALLPPLVEVADSMPSATITETRASFDVGDLAAGADADVSLQLTAPDAANFSCDDSLRTIGVVHHAGGDADPRNNIVAVDTAFDRSLAAAQEDCTSPADDDCDGMINCLDDDCTGAGACPVPIQLQDLGAQPFPPYLPWVDTPDDPLEQLQMFSNPWEIPAPPQQCEISNNHGGTITAAPMCCAPAPGIDSEHPSYFQWLSSCTPIDPNYKSAVPATNALGFGTTGPGEFIEYTITYENIGGVDAHDVAILDVLSAELDDATLIIEDGGVYDEVTRTLSWIDPVLPPEQPHTVHYTIAVRDDAPVGTRVQNTATIVFADAVPPSRVDTPPLVHVIPGPDAAVAADLRIAGCEPTSGDGWAVTVVNAGLAPAYDATARIIEAPETFTIADDACAFAHPDDPEPEQIAIVIPWATTPAIDEVRFTAPSELEDPCAELTWEIVYYTPGGEMKVVQSRLDGGGDGTASDGGDVSGDGSGDGSGEGSGEGSGGAGEDDGGGCSCRVPRDRDGAAWLGLVVVAVAARGRRRNR